MVLDAKNGEIIVCRNGPPLVVGLSDVGYFFSSDVNALLGHINKIYFLLDGEGVMASDKSLAVFDIFKDKEKSSKQQPLICANSKQVKEYSNITLLKRFLSKEKL